MKTLDDLDLSLVTGGTVIPYIVKKGDTVESLAKKFHCTEEDVCKWNSIKDPNLIFIGQKLVFMF